MFASPKGEARQVLSPEVTWKPLQPAVVEKMSTSLCASPLSDERQHSANQHTLIYRPHWLQHFTLGLWAWGMWDSCYYSKG